MNQSNRLPRLFLLAIALLLVHGIEQLLTGLDELYELKASLAPYFGLFANQDLATVLLVFAGTVAVLLLCCGFMATGLPRLLAASFFGVTFLYESHHVVKTAIRGVYFPGTVTAVPLIILGVCVLRIAWRDFRAGRMRATDDLSVPAEPRASHQSAS